MHSFLITSYYLRVGRLNLYLVLIDYISVSDNCFWSSHKSGFTIWTYIKD